MYRSALIAVASLLYGLIAVVVVAFLVMRSEVPANEPGIRSDRLTSFNARYAPSWKAAREQWFAEWRDVIWSDPAQPVMAFTKPVLDVPVMPQTVSEPNPQGHHPEVETPLEPERDVRSEVGHRAVHYSGYNRHRYWRHRHQRRQGSER